jgi:hypothetical protein
MTQEPPKMPDLDTPAPAATPSPEPTPTPQPAEPQADPSPINKMENAFADFKPDDFKFDPNATGETPPAPPAEPEIPDPPPEPGEQQLSKEERKEQNRNLRTELERYTRQILPEKEKELESVRAEKEQIAAKVEELEKAVKTYQEKLSTPDYGDFDPWQTEEIQAELQPINREFDSLLDDIEAYDATGASKLKASAPNLFNQFMALHGTADDEQKVAARNRIDDFLDENYPEDKRKIAGLFNRMAKTRIALEPKIAQITGNKQKVAYETAVKRWESARDNFKQEVEDQLFAVPEQLEQEQPWHPSVIVAKLVKTDEKVAGKAKELAEFLRYAALPLPPPDPNALAEMDPAERPAFLEARVKQHMDAQKTLHKNVGKWAVSYQLLPAMTREVAELRKRLEEIHGATPAPTGDERKPGDAVEKVDDIKKYEPPPFKFEP